VSGFGNPIIGGGGGLAYPSIHSPNYVPGNTGWTINKDGSVEFNQGVFRAAVTAAEMLLNPGPFLMYGNPATVQVTYTASGVFNVPAGVTQATIGGTGGGQGAIRGTGTWDGQGGTGGEYAQDTIDLTPLGAYPFTVGAGGAVGAPGGDTVIAGNTKTLTARGGGQPTPSTNAIVHPGGAGAALSGDGGGGGGGAGGSQQSGQNGDRTAGGLGGDIGGGQGGNGGLYPAGAGLPGIAPGGGGGGGAATFGGGAAGAAGASGKLVITYTASGVAGLAATLAAFAGTDPAGTAYPAGLKIWQGLPVDLMAASQVKVPGAAWLAPSGDGTAAADTANVEGLWNLGIHTVMLGSGTFYIQQLSWINGARLTGPGYLSAKIIAPTSYMLDMDPATGLSSNNNLENCEIDHLTLQASAGDIFWGANVTRGSVHHCQLVQNGLGFAIWNMSAAIALGTTYMAEMRFYENAEVCGGAGNRSINAWYLNADGPFAANDNRWRDNVCFNNAHDTTQPWYYLIGATGAGFGSRNNKWYDTTFEYPQGGMFRLESTTGCEINGCTAEDLASLTVGNPLIQVVSGAGTAGNQDTKIVNYSRRGGGGVGTDILLDANAFNTTIDKPERDGGGAILTLDLGHAAGVNLLNLPTISTGSPAGYQILNGENASASGNVQTIGAGTTIILRSLVQRLTCTGAAAAVKMPPGYYSGQQVTLINEGAFTITFDVSGNSNVAGGTGSIISATAAMTLTWDGGTALWYRSSP
jgi:hypothetical protein